MHESVQTSAPGPVSSIDVNFFPLSPENLQFLRLGARSKTLYKPYKHAIAIFPLHNPHKEDWFLYHSLF